MLLAAAAAALLVDGASVDADGDRISDALAKRIESGDARRTSDGRLALIVSLDEPPSAETSASLSSASVSVTKSWSSLLWASALEVDAPAGPAATVLAPLLANPHVRLIEEDAIVRASMFYSTRQTRARNVWALGIEGAKTIGAAQQSIAILDTGVDDSHPDLAVTGWADFAGAAAGTPGDEYPAPTDRGAHGSHVAGTAAGHGVVAPIASGMGTVPITVAGLTPMTTGQLQPSTFPIDTTGGASTLTTFMRWECTTCNRNAVTQLFTPAPVNTLLGTTPQQPMTGAQPISLTWSIPAGTVSNLHRHAAGTTGAGPGGNTPYFLQAHTPMTAVGDGFPLLYGVAPGANVVGVKVLDDTGSGTTQGLIDGLNFVSTNKATLGITVANMSLGIDGTIVAALDTAANNLVAGGVVLVAAAGNARQQAIPARCVGSPGSAARVITVAALNENDQITDYSSIGCVQTNNSKPDVAAPGGSFLTGKFILSIDTNDVDDNSATDRTANDYLWFNWGGTSMASPHVAGGAALLADAFPGWVFNEQYSMRMKMLLLATATETNAAAEAAPNPALGRTTKDVSEGWGRMNVDAAVDALRLTLDAGTSITTTFGELPTERQSWARTVWMREGQLYSFFLDMDEVIASQPDLDLLLYADAWTTSGASIGDPILAASSINPTPGNDEQIVSFTPPVTGAMWHRYYLVAKAITITEDEPITISAIGPTATILVDDASADWEGEGVVVRFTASAPALTWRVLAGTSPDGPFDREVESGAVEPQGGLVEVRDASPGREPWYVVEVAPGGERSDVITPAAREAGGCAMGSGDASGIGLLALALLLSRKRAT